VLLGGPLEVGEVAGGLVAASGVRGVEGLGGGLGGAGDGGQAVADGGR
jgi:hypothetical protein